MQWLSGTKVAARLEQETQTIIATHDLRPGLAVILVGDDRPSHTYVRLKEKKAEACGIHFEKFAFPAHISEEAVTDCIRQLNNRDDIHGIIIQLPLPENFDTDRLVITIHPYKDTDGFHPQTIEKFLAGDYDRLPVFPRAIITLLKEGQKELAGKAALVVVNSDLMREVLTKALSNEGIRAHCFFGDSAISVIKEEASKADIVVTATGQKHFLQAAWCKPGALIIDGGISYEHGKVYGDVDAEGNEEVTLTPIIGGVGPVTVAVLLERVTEAALRQKSN
jgi:methylenetetrahydrofolate dehydrogenase (NADP+)/methenyltetrahydrofolate cyclohydrolase